jgi:hypothetical protein
MIAVSAPETNESKYAVADVIRNAHVLLCSNGSWKGLIVVMVEALMDLFMRGEVSEWSVCMQRVCKK